MKGQFVHYAQHFLSAVEDREQDTSDGARGDKPVGLWFSVDGNGDGWKEWCTGASFAIGSLTHRTEIVFHPKAKLLRVKGARAVDRLTQEYGCAPAYTKLLKRSSFDYKGYAIDWPRIAKRYDGIVIAPYVWPRRLHMGTHWYYSWDCASGCVWRARAIAALNQLDSHPEYVQGFGCP